ncbi:hypothetical protein SAMN06265367_103409 [Algoriphagus winogradskyi]|uniref:Uncharacterized protein n=1 Tax=Algoriphagus winogradskyi TaxID=237017 RepID=A0ABY1NYP8_9BACT|nr:hypothetical protein SAMN06265367_103409 [Algoriphagus winogradskyi]
MFKYNVNYQSKRPKLYGSRIKDLSIIERSSTPFGLTLLTLSKTLPFDSLI